MIEQEFKKAVAARRHMQAAAKMKTQAVSDLSDGLKAAAKIGTIAEVDEALALLPATWRQIEAIDDTAERDHVIELRAELTKRRAELIEAERAAAAAAEALQDQAGLLEVMAPDGIGCIEAIPTPRRKDDPVRYARRVTDGRFRYAEIVNGRRIIRMTVLEFAALLRSRGSNKGRPEDPNPPTAEDWRALNPGLAQRIADLSL
jgi:hypothetical protein